jgi:cyclic beta-1,2-glucan synthetase
MSGGIAVVAMASIVALAGGAARGPASWQVLLPFVLLWLAGPLIAMRVSRPLTVVRDRLLSIDDQKALRVIARRTWRYFETFVTPAHHMLPPDNFQEEPKPVVAARTSPTNLGLYLLSAIAARDFGWAGTHATVERIEATLASMRRLPRFNGHFYNWYATEDLRALDPPYVSSVDSGNLAGHLIVVANACESWCGQPVAVRSRSGMLDALSLVDEAVAALGPSSTPRPQPSWSTGPKRSAPPRASTRAIATWPVTRCARSMAGSWPSPTRPAPSRWRWTSRSCSTRNASCCRSATR